ncbi:YolD-like family protein [Pallidibacillus pasinlerensis]|uniref:YolD-like family protein n=1 Tax=Pallidibacillus pasinlerensis TaxID=2703818 RepID=A0ABX0A947_9BACI|nr:YolD-like family protein [Pallidibacillus pasinlerensis]NCU19086.1 YolD-like family protein [Pallidibacillus pasinlerensis]
MLPEHVKMLWDWAKEDLWEKPKELDEQKLEEMDETIRQAVELNQQVAISYYNDNERRNEIVTGKIRSYDIVTNELQMISENGEVYEIPLQPINDIDLTE